MSRPLQIKSHKYVGDYLELFFVSAVSSVFIIRAFLHITGYPQIGGGGYHFAHVLWGGFFMCSALILGLSFFGKRILQTVAVLGGIGFGTFLDELGKYVTADNNYFFQPTIAIMYLIFVALFFLFRVIESHGNLVEDPLESIYQKNVHIVTAAERKLGFVIEKIAKNVFFQKIVLSYLFITAIYGLIRTTSVIIRYFLPFTINWAGTVGIISYLSSAVEVLLATLGVYYFRIDRLRSLTYFKYSIIAAIVLKQFFLFYRSQLGAVDELLVELALLVVVRTMIFEIKNKA